MLPQHVIAQGIPAPPRQVVGKLVQLEMIFQSAMHHVVFDNGIRDHMNSIQHVAQIDTHAPVAWRTRLQSNKQKGSTVSMIQGSYCQRPVGPNRGFTTI